MFLFGFSVTVFRILEGFKIQRFKNVFAICVYTHRNSSVVIQSQIQEKHLVVCIYKKATYI